MSERIKWRVEQRKLSELRPYPKNPRIITEDGLSELKRSFDEIGVAQLINISQNNVILSGHARWNQLMSEDENQIVDVMVADRALTPKQEEAVIVRMNKNVAGKWDFDILANEFEIEDLKEWGFEESDFFDDIKELSDDEISEACTFSIKCENLKELEILKNRLGTSKKNMTFINFVGLINEDNNS